MLDSEGITIVSVVIPSPSKISLALGKNFWGAIRHILTSFNFVKRLSLSSKKIK
jgi:hypothetical protein